jgi:hypothetical protein
MVCAHILLIHLCLITILPFAIRIFPFLVFYCLAKQSIPFFFFNMASNPIVRAAQRAARAISRVANAPIPGFGRKTRAIANGAGALLFNGLRNRGGLNVRPTSTTVTVRAPRARTVVKQRAFPQSSQGIGARRTRKPNATKRKHYMVHVPYREECLGNVVSSGTAGAFSLASYVLNIGNSTSFPQGSIMAPLFQRHRFRKLVYRIETTSGMAIGSTSTALGSTLLNCDYNVVDTVFPDQIHMEDYGKNGVNKMCKETVIYKNNTFNVDCSRSLTLEPDDWMFVQPGTTGATVTSIPNTSEHEYAHGLMQVASVGLQGTSQVIGRLFVGYESDFAICITPSAGVGAISAHITEGAIHTATDIFPLGTTGGVLAVGSNLLSVATSTTFSLPTVGTWLVTAAFTGTGIGAAPSLSAGSNITTAVNYFNDDTTTNRPSFTSTIANIAQVFTVATAGTGANNLITIAGLTSMTAGRSDVFITQLNNLQLTSSFPPASDMSLRLLALEKRLAEVNLKSDDDDDIALVCPCCDTVKLNLPFNGYCSKRCLVHSDSLEAKDNLIHLGDDETFVRVTPHSATSVFPGIPLSEKDDYIARLSPLWNNVLPIPSTLSNCVDLVCRGRRDSPRPTLKLPASITSGL